MNEYELQMCVQIFRECTERNCSARATRVKQNISMLIEGMEKLVPDYDQLNWKHKERYSGLTLTFPYFQVKSATNGKQPIVTHSRTRRAVLSSQFNDTTQGESSSQNSQPSAHSKHSKKPSTAYWLSSP